MCSKGDLLMLHRTLKESSLVNGHGGTCEKVQLRENLVKHYAVKESR